MQPATHPLLVQLVTLSGLIGGTIEYAEIIKRRARLRVQVAERAWYPENGGLRGLVRVYEAPPRSRWPTLPSRSHLAADLGWAAIGLIALVIGPFVLLIYSVLRAWRAVRP
jgi:hypothetical protein